jgi:hypothetical protein
MKESKVIPVSPHTLRDFEYQVVREFRKAYRQVLACGALPDNLAGTLPAKYAVCIAGLRFVRADDPNFEKLKHLLNHADTKLEK